MKKKIIFATLIAIMVALASSISHGQSSFEKRGSYFTSEFKRFNSDFHPHIKQLSRCQAEMIAKNVNIIGAKDNECLKSKNMHPATLALIRNVGPVIESYVKTLTILGLKNYSGNEFDQSFIEAKETFTQITLFTLKFKTLAAEISDRLISNVSEMADELKYNMQTIKAFGGEDS